MTRDLNSLLTCFLLPVCCGAPLMAAPAAERLEIRLNDASLEPSGRLVYQPGTLNRLRVEPLWAQLPHPRLTLELNKIRPDGSIETQRAEVQRGQTGEFVLGPLTAPPVYEYRRGEVLRRGYGLQVTASAPQTRGPLCQVDLCQGDGAEPRNIVAGAVFKAGTECFVRGPAQASTYRPHVARAEPLTLKLADTVLSDPDAVTALCQLTDGACVEQLPARLLVRDRRGKQVQMLEVALGPPGKAARIALDVTAWPSGDYRITLCPVVDGKTWEEGPEIVYRRRPRDPREVRISPMVPWSLRRDRGRDEVTLSDFRSLLAPAGQTLPEGWQFAPAEGPATLLCPAGVDPQPVELRPGLSGYYAVYATPAGDGCALQVGPGQPVRMVLTGEARQEAFLCAVDLTDAPIRLFACDSYSQPKSGLARLRFVPVTAASVRHFYRATSRPPVPLRAVADWAEYFHGTTRVAEDQIAAIVAGQAELGLSTLSWSVGRSWVEYHSKLPDSQVFPCVPVAQAEKVFPGARAYLGRIRMMERYDPLDLALAARKPSHVAVWPWLSMNRHYGDTYGGMFASPWFRNHPQWQDWLKNAKAPLGSIVCYYFPEVRQERVDILLEVARRAPDGLVIGCCRQVPMLLYHPEMVAAFKRETGLDPQTFDASSPEPYQRWIRWRANHFTEVLRMLRQQLQPIEAEQGRRLPVAVRLPSVGLFLNLAQGLDVEQWLREGLVDCLQLDPLETCGGEGQHDVRPYLDLGKRFHLPVLGGVGSTWTAKGPSHVAALHRALSLLEAGVDGIEIYETECQARANTYRWLLPLMGNPVRLRQFLTESNLEACFPLTAASAHAGHDNHSKWGPGGWSWDVHGNQGPVL
jgi:hypothetical protein